MTVVRTFLLLVIALICQLLIGRTWPGVLIYVNFLTLVVFHVSLNVSPIAGMLAGSLGGLFQDAFSDQVIGISSVGKTLAAYVLGELSIKLDIRSPLFLGLTMFAASCVDILFSVILDRVIGLEPILPTRAVLTISVGNAIAGTAIIKLREKVRGSR